MIRRRGPGVAAPAVAVLLLTAFAVAWLQTRNPSPDRQPDEARSTAAARGGAQAGGLEQEPAAAAEADRRYDLGPDERRGGHTLERHVGRSAAELRQRLQREDISAASTYPDRETAERVVATTLARHRSRIDAWLAREGRRPNLALEYQGTVPIGQTLERGAAAPVAATDALVVLRWAGGRDFYVLTSYPDRSR